MIGFSVWFVQFAVQQTQFTGSNQQVALHQSQLILFQSSQVSHLFNVQLFQLSTVQSQHHET